MAAPKPEDLAQALRTITEAYAAANQGSAEHPLGRATVGSIQDMVPKAPPAVLQGYAIRFEDGTTYLVNVHLMPALKA